MNSEPPIETPSPRAASPRSATPGIRVITCLIAASTLLGLSGCTPSESAPISEAKATPREERPASDIEALRALPYAPKASGRADRALRGVTRFDRERVQPGYNLLVVEEECAAELLRPNGSVAHRWQRKPCSHWGHAELLADGSLLVIATEGPEARRAAPGRKGRLLMKLGWNGELLWKRRMTAHHELDVLPNGRIAVLTSKRRRDARVHPTARIHDNRIEILDADGKTLETASILDLLLSRPDRFSVQPVEAREKEDGVESIGLLHCNGLEWMQPGPELLARDPVYGPGHFLLTCRHQDAVAIIDWRERELVWAWGQGEISGPHDATLLANGNVLLFDNGLGREWSRVVEVDPLRDEIVWEYRADGFYTIARGSSQRLANGNTLIADSEDGRALEVTPDGEMVWEYFSPYIDSDERRALVPKIRRIDPQRLAELPRRGEP